MKFAYPKISTIDMNTSPGFYSMTNEAYHAGSGLSSSRVKKALESHAAFHAPPPEPTDAMAFGTAFHCALLEPEVFAAKYVRAKAIEGNKNSNAYKAELAAWISSVPDGSTILSTDDFDTIQAMVAVVKDHPEWARMPAYDCELTAIASMDGMQVKCRADSFGSAIYDFKTTSGLVTPGPFSWAVMEFGYHVSAAFYQDIFHLLTGERLPFIIVPVSKPGRSGVIDCEYYELSDGVLAEGRKLYQCAMRRISRWYSEPQHHKTEKRIRLLNPTTNMLYRTTEIIDFLEGR